MRVRPHHTTRTDTLTELRYELMLRHFTLPSLLSLGGSYTSVVKVKERVQQPIAGLSIRQVLSGGERISHSYIPNQQMKIIFVTLCSFSASNFRHKLEMQTIPPVMQL